MKKLTAKWIWDSRGGKDIYNQSIVASKQFNLPAIKEANILITADSYYRLYINGSWVCDGPARAWTEHYQYDNVDITSMLCSGNNEVRIVARHFGCGTFHQVPAGPGLLAQVNAVSIKGKKITIGTDNSWQTSQAKFLACDTPKISIQMEPAELYDATQETKLKFAPAQELFEADKGLWKDLSERNVAMLSREPVVFTKFLGASKIVDSNYYWCVPVRRLVMGDCVEANKNPHFPIALATIVDVKKACTVNFSAVRSMGATTVVSVDGSARKSGSYKLDKGKHTVIAFAGDNFDHTMDMSLILEKNDAIELVNPVKAGYENPWVVVKFDEYCFASDDLDFRRLLEARPDFAEKVEAFKKLKTKLLKSAKSVKDFEAAIGSRAKCMPSKKMFVREGHMRFINAVRQDGANVDNPQALMSDNPQITTVRAGGDVELVYDLGVQRCGYYHFEMIADAGVEVDIYGVEYITSSGKIQHSDTNRNGLTYITKAGVNKFVSFKRRSGRYLFISLRGIKSDIRIRHFGVIESTYPVEYRGSFNCSDQNLNKIWEISARTLKLCMEDTFTDCPLYEQTLWVGDARNESLFAYQIFGAEDIAYRCIELTAQSLEKYPIAGAQLPSAWECLLPAWSMLWGISVWEYYWYSGDKERLAKMMPFMLKNIDGACAMRDDSGLMSCDYWNFFDWSNIDANHNVVLYNSLLLAGAIDAAVKSAEVLGDKKSKTRLEGLKAEIAGAVNKYWIKQTGAYPDSIHNDGSISQSICQHTNFLAYLYDVSEKGFEKDILNSMVAPADGMIKVGSPFAIMYLFEALEKAGYNSEIISSIRENYIPMLKADASTVWESFPTGSLARDGFPTRSHCHAWSSAPIYFFTRIILGFRQTKPAGEEFEISPWVEGLGNAAGIVATHQGDIEIDWQIVDGKLSVNCKAPKSVKVKFVANSSMKGLKRTFKRL